MVVMANAVVTKGAADTVTVADDSDDTATDAAADNSEIRGLIYVVATMVVAADANAVVTKVAAVTADDEAQ